MELCALLCVIVSSLHPVFTQDPPSVTIPQGALQGKFIATRSGRSVSGFLGIPYAAPPVGYNRFRSPQPAEGWTGTRDASQYGSECSQNNLLIPEAAHITIGQEDCLFLNVFTPQADPEAYLPVMVWIHGGGFFAGSSQAFAGPEYMLDKDIVLVTINYRLGALGFLSTEDEVQPGNNGLKDQTAALRWVRDNIRYFGGNKDSVTIFGESAGGGSVGLHSMSPLSKGLFHAAIAQSGTGHCPWTSYPPGIHKMYALKMGKHLGCHSTDSKQLVNCLRKIPHEKLSNIIYEFLIWDLEPLVLFRPSVEPSQVKDAFLTAYPSETVTSVPLMVGLTSDEGAMRLSMLTHIGLDEGLSEVNTKFEEVMAMSLMLYEKTKSPEEVVRRIKKFYFGDKEINRNVNQGVLDMYTDALFLNGIIKTLRQHKGPAFFYYFNYKGGISVAPLFGNKNFHFGVCHMDELLYLFPMDNLLNRNNTPKQDTEMSEKLVELWTNFATYRNPTPKASPTTWEPVTSSDLEYLHIKNDGFVMKKNLLKERVDFWSSLQLHDKLNGIEYIHKSVKDEL